MEEGQNILALMLKKKRAEGSLDMPVKKKKKKKQKKEEEPPPPPPPEPEPELVVTVVDPPPQDNEFFDAACKAADEQMNKPQQVKFDKKVRKLNGILARLHASLEEMKSRYHDLDIEELLSKKPNKRKIAKARAFVKKQMVQKNEFGSRMDGIRAKQQQRKKKEEVDQEMEEARQKQKQLEQLKKELQEKKRQKEKEQKENAAKEEKAKQLIGKFSDDQYLYEKMEKLQQKREEKKEKAEQAYLQKRKAKFQPIDSAEIDIHMKAHLQRLRDSALLKEQEQLEKHHQMMQQNLKLLENIYRGKNYEMAQQEAEERRLERLRAKQQRDKVKQYALYVKENFKPEAKDGDEEEEDELGEQNPSPRVSDNNEEGSEEESDDNEEKIEKYPKFRKVKRYKFLQGKSCGEIVETVKLPLSERLQRRLGNGYLEHVYSLPKKKPTSNPSKSEAESVGELKTQQRPKIEMPILPRPKHFSVRISEAPNRVEVENMLMLLKSRDKQLEMKQKHLTKAAGGSESFELHRANQIHDDIISNIERKLSLLKQL